MINNAMALNTDLNKTGWIPVTERLPNAGERVLITVFNPDFDTPAYTSIDHLKANGEEWFLNSKSDVTAWMPLPEPYKGEE